MCVRLHAALVSVVNTKFPELGELLLHRLCLQFIRSYKRNDKPVCTAAARFLGQLINQGVAHEVRNARCMALYVPSHRRAHTHPHIPSLRDCAFAAFTKAPWQDVVCVRAPMRDC